MIFLVLAPRVEAYRCHYRGTAKDGAGNILPLATINIYEAATTKHALVYTSLSDTIPKKLVTSDGSGVFELWISRFDYDREQKFKLVISKPGYTSVIWDNVSIDSAALATYSILEDTTVTTGLNPPRGVIYSIANGKTLTINGHFTAGPYQIFSGDGSVAFGRGATSTAYPTWWGAAGNGKSDDIISINAALSSGAPIVDGLDLPYAVSSSVKIATNSTLKNIKLLALTAGMNIVLVNSGSSLLSSKITGTGKMSIVERGVYPAADGVTDVKIEAEISNLTYGVHAQPIALIVPKRWEINVYVHDIVGTSRRSEGYGVLLSPAEKCWGNIKAKNIKRHAVYLSAGASHNDFYVDVDTCENIAIQILAYSRQLPCQHNTIRGLVRGSYIGGYVGLRSNYNNFNMDVIASDKSYMAYWVEGASGGPYPVGNIIEGCSILGQFAGHDVIQLLNADGTKVLNNTIHASASFSVVASKQVGSFNGSSGGWIHGNSIDGQGKTIYGIYCGINTANTILGYNDIQNNGTGIKIKTR